MSVLVRNDKKQMYIFVKGSPEKILLNSRNANKNIHLLLNKLSLEGLRSIGLGYK